MTHSPLLRQSMVVLSPQLAAFSVGGAVTISTLLMEQFRSNDSSIQMDVHTRSWIGSIYGLAGIPMILMPVITQKIGRKWGYIIACLYVLIGWILTYTATTTTELLISESFHGMGVSSLMPISFLGMSEMLAPKYRFISMQAFGIAQCCGIATGGIFGRFLHFRTISIIMIIPITAAIAIALLWPESPAWLACKGDFDKCKQTFIKLRGTDDMSELTDLIHAQRGNLMRQNQITWNGLRQKITSRDFYMPALHIFILMDMLYWSGGDAIFIYFIQLASKTTSNKNATFYATIVMYLITLVNQVITNVLIIRFKNKQVLLSSVLGVAGCLTALTVLTGLQSLSILSKDSILPVICLLFYITFASLGLFSMVFVISAELMPVKHRSLGGALYIVFNCVLYATSLKISPYLFLYIGFWGTFLIFAMNAVLCAWYVWRYIPETKGRSLQEIEDYYMYGRFIERRTEEVAVDQTLLDSER